MYKAITVEYSAKAKKMAAKIEEAANRMEEEGYELISVSIMPSAKGILIFRKENGDLKATVTCGRNETEESTVREVEIIPQ